MHSHKGYVAGYNGQLVVTADQVIARARRRLLHLRGQDDYKLRARIVEPAFGQLKTCQNMTMMSRRGLTACESEWLPGCTAHNLRKLHCYLVQGYQSKAHSASQDLTIAQDRRHVPPLRSKIHNLPSTRLCATGWLMRCRSLLRMPASSVCRYRLAASPVTQRTSVQPT